MLVVAANGNIQAQSVYLKTEHIRILGNCEMCKSQIEKSGFKKGIASVQWDSKSKIATVKYDSLKQTSEEILKRIALAGYDNEIFLAPAEAYLKLPECCKYERSLKRERASDIVPSQTDNQYAAISPLDALFTSYFDLKDSFVQSDPNDISIKAANLVKQIVATDNADMKEDQHFLWLKINQHMNAISMEISKSDKIDKQRTIFSELSQDFYELAKVANLGYEVFFQHCPMFYEGADWLSKEPQIKNPFYGNEMLTCGKTMEIIK